jgi:hypothetical protein
MIDTLVLGALVLASENRGRKLLDAAAANWTKVEARRCRGTTARRSKRDRHMYNNLQ